MRKLNFGCGSRFSDEWTNIDFHSASKAVQKVNLLGGFPFQDEYFDCVYSSHVLEHFSLEQARFLLTESYRVMKPGGVIRVVVPDLEESCREYLRILELPDDYPGKQKLYDWSIIELIDQLVRNKRGGRMAEIMNHAGADRDSDFVNYIRSRTENMVSESAPKKSFSERVSSLTMHKFMNRITYSWLNLVSKLIPSDLRSLVFVSTGVGERHQWMYDRYGLESIVKSVGFRDVRLLSFDQSQIPGFNNDFLDGMHGGIPYKNVSVYLEAVR